MATATPSTEAGKALSPTQKKPKGKANSKASLEAKPQAQATASSPITPPIEAMSSDDPFAASNFAVDGDQVPTGVDDLNIEVGAPSDEEFVLVSSDPRHMLKANLLVVDREGGYGKSYFILTPPVAAFVKAQASLKKFLKPMRIFLYVTSEGQYGLWLVRDSFDNWSVSDLQVVNQAKKAFTRRYTDGKVRKGHSSTAIPTEGVSFPDKPLTGQGGILQQAFGEAFAITTTDHPVLNKLLGKA